MPRYCDALRTLHGRLQKEPRVETWIESLGISKSVLSLFYHSSLQMIQMLLLGVEKIGEICHTAASLYDGESTEKMEGIAHDSTPLSC